MDNNKIMIDDDLNINIHYFKNSDMDFVNKLILENEEDEIVAYIGNDDCDIMNMLIERAIKIRDYNNKYKNTKINPENTKNKLKNVTLNE